ncbi:MAG: SET domain-containing protein [Bacteroidetes bacterium]|nr:SET domain-containing protein [Bacteroidota bacterium]
MILPCLFVASAGPMGRGVFTSQDMAAGSLVEAAPVIVMSAGNRKHLDQTLLQGYIFEWGESKEECCMALGYVPLYNHSYKSNCEYEMDFENGKIYIKAVRDIKAGEELFINYNGNFDETKPVWFEVK